MAGKEKGRKSPGTGRARENLNATARVTAVQDDLVEVEALEDLEGKPADLVKNEAFGRGAEVWEVANVMMFLASDYSSYMTGEIVPVSSQRA